MIAALESAIQKTIAYTSPWYHSKFRFQGQWTTLSSLIPVKKCFSTDYVWHSTKKHASYLRVEMNSLLWRHNERYGVSDHQPHDYLLNRLFRRRSKKPSKLRVTDLCGGNSPGIGEFPTQRASNAENVSVWWRHHAQITFHTMITCLTVWYNRVLMNISWCLHMLSIMLINFVIGTIISASRLPQTPFCIFK